MGAWSAKSFDNDEAEEFLSMLTEDEEAGTDILKDTLTSINLRDLSEEDDCTQAVAACEIVAAAAGHPMAGLPSEAKAWIRNCHFRPTASLQKRAQQVATAILKSSALADLWSESDENSGWRRSMQSLIDRLSKPAKIVRIQNTAAPKASASEARKRTGATPQKSARTVAARTVVANKPEHTANAAKPASLNEARSIIKKKLGGGYAGPAEKNKQLVDISFGTSRRLPGLRDAERLATLPNVDAFTVGGQKLSAGHIRSLQILITGWTTLRVLEATGTTGGLAKWICQAAPSMESLEVLKLDFTDVTDADLAELRKCERLRSLDLASTGISVAGLKSLQGTSALQRVSVSHCKKISVADLSKFAISKAVSFELICSQHDEDLGIKFPGAKEKTAMQKKNSRIQQIFNKAKDVWPNRFFDSSLVAAKSPTVVPWQDIATECEITSLVIGSEWDGDVQDMSDDDLRTLLTAWPGLTSLRFGNMSDCEPLLIECLSRLKKLQVLELNETPCDDSLIPAIAGLPQLVRLELINTQISGAALQRLHKIGSLRWISLTVGNSISLADAQQLQKKLAGKAWVDIQ